MSEIVYYDENPTVRELMLHTLSRFGCDIVLIPNLNQCEEILKNCHHPIALIIDMSRYPEKLTRLQTIVPTYIPQADQCILTSTKPSSLANFLPENIETCFFKHIVERPFKRLDFAQFIENIIHPFMGRTYEPSYSLSMSMLNSSVSQIISPSISEPLEDNLKKQVENIASTSRAIPIQNLRQASASESSSYHKSAVGSASYHKSERISQTESPVTVLDVLEHSGILPSLPDEESTEFVGTKPPLFGIRESVVSEPSSISIIHPIPAAQFAMDMKSFFNVLNETTFHNSRQTLVCHEGAVSRVMIIEAGRVQWCETLQNDLIVDETRFLQNLPHRNKLPVQEILSLMRQDLTMPDAISALNKDEEAVEICEHIIHDAMLKFPSLDGKNIELYHEVPAPWNLLMSKRPIQGIDVAPMLFDVCRANEETVIAPDIYRFASFAMRPYRTPLNRAILLTDEENEALIAIRTPRTISELKRTKFKNAGDLLYRLVLFEFADLVG